MYTQQGDKSNEGQSFSLKNCEVYHTNNKCGAGNEIPTHDRVKGDGGFRQCKNCKLAMIARLRGLTAVRSTTNYPLSVYEKLDRPFRKRREDNRDDLSYRRKPLVSSLFRSSVFNLGIIQLEFLWQAQLSKNTGTATSMNRLLEETQFTCAHTQGGSIHQTKSGMSLCVV